MKTETKFLAIIFIATIALIAGAVFFLSKQSTSTTNSEIVEIDYSKGQKVGSDSAKVKLVEFSDFECPACAAIQPLVNKIKSENPQNVQLIYRHFPLPQHKFGKLAATVAEAASEQGKFWEMHDKLFETQSQWSTLPDAAPFFMNLAKELNLDEEKIKQAIESDALKTKVEEDLSEGRRLNVSSTPYFFLNGKRLNLRTFEDLNAAVAEELKK